MSYTAYHPVDVDANKTRSALVVWWIVGSVVVLVLLYLAWTYNRLVSLNKRADGAWSDIDVQLKRRWDLVPALVETVKGYARHESSTLESVVQARSEATQAGSLTQRGESRARALVGGRPVIRPGRGISRAQGQPEFPGAAEVAGRDREQCPVRPALLQRGGARPEHPGSKFSLEPGGIGHGVRRANLFPARCRRACGASGGL